MPHIHEKIDWTVEVFIVHKNKVLIRKHDKYDNWLGVGGHIELHEDPIEAARRECREEVQLPVYIYGEEFYIKDETGRLNIPPPAFINRHPINETHEHITLVYIASAETDTVTPERAEDTWLWLTKDEVETNTEMTNEIKRYARYALDTLVQRTT